MVESSIAFTSSGKQLIGMIHIPIRGNGAAVILCHGFTGSKMENKRLFVETARSLADAGFMAFRFDFYGSGDSMGEIRETRIDVNIQNLMDTFTLVKNSGYEKIMVLGISVGAATAILAADEIPIDALVLWSSVPNFAKVFEAKLGRPIESVPVQETYEYDGWLVDRKFYLEAVQYDIPAHLKKLTMPKLIVQGSEDDLVMIEGFKDFQAIAPKPVEFAWIEGAGHTYQTVAHRKKVISITKDWLSKTIK